MKMKIIVVAVMLLAVGSNLLGQAGTIEKVQLDYTNFMMQSHSQLIKSDKNFVDYGGDKRYFSNEWLPGGAVNFSDVTISEKYRFNFDFKEQELYAQWNDTMIVVNSNYLKSFYLIENGVTHYFTREASIDGKIFLESLGYNPAKSSGIQILKLRTVKVRKADKNSYTANFNGDYRDDLSNKVEYYLLSGKTNVKIKLNKKSLLDALPVYKEKVEAFFNSNSTVDENNIGQLVTILNR